MADEGNRGVDRRGGLETTLEAAAAGGTVVVGGATDDSNGGGSFSVGFSLSPVAVVVMLSGVPGLLPPLLPPPASSPSD